MVVGDRDPAGRLPTTDRTGWRNPEVAIANAPLAPTENVAAAAVVNFGAGWTRANGDSEVTVPQTTCASVSTEVVASTQAASPSS